MDDKAERNSTSPIVGARVGGTGISASAIEEGRCVNTIVLMSPRRRASGAAKRVERADRKKAIDDTLPSVDEESGANLVERK